MSEQKPFGTVVGWDDEDGNIPVKWHDTPATGQDLFTADQLKAERENAINQCYEIIMAQDVDPAFKIRMATQIKGLL